MKFKSMIQDEKINRALDILGYETMTPVQEEVLPILFAKRDCLVQSKTGSGKTASYALPIIYDLEIDQKDPQALVLVPTRELALQIKESFDQLGVYKKIKTLAIFGKQPFQFQKEDLNQRCHVVIGTPGRILDHLEQGTLRVDSLKYLVLDEADEMLNMNFFDIITEIVSYLPKERVTCLCSATMGKNIERLASGILRCPQKVSVETKKNGIDSFFYLVAYMDKLDALAMVLEKETPLSCMIFANTREEVDRIYAFLESYSCSVAKIHGAMKQEDRLACMKKFKQGKKRILVSTDVSARGIDVDKVDLIINYEVANTPAIYTHRIGRTARMHETGKVYNFVTYREQIKLKEIEENLSLSFDVQNLEIQRDHDLSKLMNAGPLKKDVTKDLRKDIYKLYFNGGKNKKIRPGDLVGAICSIDGVSFEDIGVIQVQDHQSYVDILNGKGKLVLKALQRCTIKNKKLRVQRAKN